MALDRPVLITGTPRSGKSCVWRILAESREFAAIPEPIMIWDAGIKRPDDSRTEKDATPRIRRRIRSQCEAIVRKADKERYMDAFAYHSVRLGFVQAVMPEARVIHVIRDPVDIMPELVFGWTYRGGISNVLLTRRRHVDFRTLPRLATRFVRSYVSSLLRGRREHWGPSVPGLAEFRRNHSPVEIAAFQWVTMVTLALQDIERLPELDVLEVRYDQLVSAPEREARRITDFVEAEDAGAAIRYAASQMKQNYVHHVPNRAAISEDDWLTIDAAIRPLQERLGYSSRVLPGTTPST